MLIEFVVSLFLSIPGAFAHLQPFDSPFCHLDNFTFTAHRGSGSGELLKGAVYGGCDAVRMSAAAPLGMAASFASPQLSVQGGYNYTVSFDIQTENLVPVDAPDGAYLSGSVYVHFLDQNEDFGAWQPQFGSLAPSSLSKWTPRVVTFSVPTTAKYVVLHLAFGAHTFAYAPNRMLGGRASGTAMLGNIIVKKSAPYLPIMSSISIPDDSSLQAAVDQAFACLHNSQLSGNFTVGAGYTISGNISPDLTFGLYGIRRTAIQRYISTIQKQWKWHDPAPDGQYTAGRVMGQVNWILGAVQLYEATGDAGWLCRNIGLMDASLAYVQSHADAHGLSTLIPVGDGHTGGGADWVDWYKTRLDGRTFMFHLWLIRALEQTASMHVELESMGGTCGCSGNVSTAGEYLVRARALSSTLRSLYWKGDHWTTSVDYPDQGEWMDDTVWSIFLGLASDDVAAQLWSRIDSNQSFFEGVPIRWGAFPTTHSACSWFGRLGAGDILGRLKRGNATRALELMQRFAAVVNAGQDIYEGYTMDGCGLQRCGCTTNGYGDYLEHCGGTIWTVLEGFFGVDLRTVISADDSTFTAAASIVPRFPSAWKTASADVFIRGNLVSILWNRNGNSGALRLSHRPVYPVLPKPLLLEVGCNSSSLRVVPLQPGVPFILRCSF